MNLTWRKSSRSAANGHCVEVAPATGAMHVRDSKDPQGPMLTFDSPGWHDFVAGVRDGEFDRRM